jgi:hypothetical protein
MYTLNDLDHIVTNFPKHITRCMYTQDIIIPQGTLKKHWSADAISNSMPFPIVFHYHHLNIIARVIMKLTAYSLNLMLFLDNILYQKTTVLLIKK